MRDSEMIRMILDAEDAKYILNQALNARAEYLLKKEPTSPQTFIFFSFSGTQRAVILAQEFYRLISQRESTNQEITVTHPILQTWETGNKFYWEFVDGTDWARFAPFISDRIESNFRKNYSNFQDGDIIFDVFQCAVVYQGKPAAYARCKIDTNVPNYPPGCGIFPYCVGSKGSYHLLVGLEKRREGMVIAPFGGRKDRPDKNPWFTAARETFEETLGIFPQEPLYHYLERNHIEVFQDCFLVNLGVIDRNRRNDLVTKYNRIKKPKGAEILEFKWIEIDQAGTFEKQNWRTYFREHLPEMMPKFWGHIQSKNPLPVYSKINY